MPTALTIEARRADLERRLKNAKARYARAGRDVDEIEGELTWLTEQEDLVLIRSWRGTPDWPRLLAGPASSMPMFMLGQHMLRRLGFSNDGYNRGTGQAIVSFGIAAGDPAHVERVRRGIEYLAPFLLPIDTGDLHLLVYADKADGFGLSLDVSPSLDRADLVRSVWTTEAERQRFDSLGEALIHIQTSWPWEFGDGQYQRAEDAPGETGEALRQAVAAFVEGCIAAGIPIEQAA